MRRSGMRALADVLLARGWSLTGSDVHPRSLNHLRSAGVMLYEGHEAEHLPSNAEIVVHSDAVDADNPELRRAGAIGATVLSYFEMVGRITQGRQTLAIAGTHGKSTTTAMIGTLIKEIDLPASVIAGTAVPTFGGRSTVSLGSDFLVAETCEYRRHFHLFHPDRIILTNVELDHTDYFATEEDIRDAFVTYAERLPPGGELIFCADDPGAAEVAAAAVEQNPDITSIPYGQTATGPYRIRDLRVGEGRTVFRIDAMEKDLELRIPGRHNVLNAVASIALLYCLIEKKRGDVTEDDSAACVRALKRFQGSRRRSQIVGRRDGVLFIDDYGHHPTAIRRTLDGYREFYPGRRIVLDFMSHTYTRTKDFLDEFVRAFDNAEVVLLHRIYASAREPKGGVTGRDLYEAVRKRRGCVHYFHEVMEAFEFCRDLLEPGDIFITMGAGDNWRLATALAEYSAS